MTDKIAVLAPDLSGGGGTRVYLIADVLKKLNYDTRVYGYVFGEKLYPPPPENLPVQYLKGCNYPGFIGKIGGLVDRIDADLIYAIKPRPTSFGTALIKRALSRKPVILDIDDWEMSWFGGDNWRYAPRPRGLIKDLFRSEGGLRQPDHPLYLSWTEKLIDRADAITVNNRFLRERYGGTYLPNGKDTDLFDPDLYDPEESRRKYGLENYRILMFPGTARPHKGIEDVLDALEEIAEPDLKLVLVGGRSIGDSYLESLLERGRRWLIHLPPQPIDRMPAVVAAAHVIIVPQRDNATANAQFPIKLTDGMAMAKPIVATTVGDIPSILQDKAYLVPPGSPPAIATALREIFQNPERAILKGKQLREHCVNHYSTIAMARILDSVLKSIQFK